MNKSFLPYLTNREVVDAAAQDRVLLLPLGTVESNGPHQLLGCDFIVSEALAQAVAATSEALRMPTFHYGISELHAGLPGTFDLMEPLFSGLLEQLLLGASRTGFRRAVLFNCHRHNHQPIEVLARKLRREGRMAVAMIDPLEAAKDLCKEVFEGDAPGAVGHGGEPLMSLIAHLRPEEIRMDLVGSAELQPFMGMQALSSTRFRFQGGRVGLFPLAEEINASGAWADVSMSTAERGRIAFERVSAFATDFVRTFGTAPLAFPAAQAA